MKYTVESGQLREVIEAPTPRQAAADFLTLASLTGPEALGLMIEVTGPDDDPVYFTADNIRADAYPTAK